MVLEVLAPVLRLFLFTAFGYALFRIPKVRALLLRPFVFVTVNIVFPLYFIHSLPSQWASGLEAGWRWMAIFFLAYLAFLGVQTAIGKLLINRVGFMKTRYPRELLVLFAMHNAGYIPIPIIAALAPPALSVYMSFYTLPFVLSFFTIAVWIIRDSAMESRLATGDPLATGNASQGDRIGSREVPGSRRRPAFRLNAPVVGIVIGIVGAVTGIYSRLPGWATFPFRIASYLALDGVMVVLGAVLASIPPSSLKYRKEFTGFIAVKLIAFPLVVVVGLLFLPLSQLDPGIAAGIKLAFVVEAAVPPATNIIVITKAYGTDDQVEYAGSAMIVSYLAALVLLPAFIIAARLLYG